MVDYKVGDWVERVHGGDDPRYGVHKGETYKVVEIKGNGVSFECPVGGGWDYYNFRLAKNTIVRNILNDL